MDQRNVEETDTRSAIVSARGISHREQQPAATQRDQLWIPVERLLLLLRWLYVLRVLLDVAATVSPAEMGTSLFYRVPLFLFASRSARWWWCIRGIYKLITWPWAAFQGTCLLPGTLSSYDPEIWKSVIFRYTYKCFGVPSPYTHLFSVKRSHSRWKTARLGSRRTASGSWLQARSTSSEICPNITELEMDEHELIGLRITLRILSLNRDSSLRRLFASWDQRFRVYLTCYDCSKIFWESFEAFASHPRPHWYRFATL